MRMRAARTAASPGTAPGRYCLCFHSNTHRNRSRVTRDFGCLAAAFLLVTGARTSTAEPLLSQRSRGTTGGRAATSTSSKLNLNLRSTSTGGSGSTSSSHLASSTLSSRINEGAMTLPSMPAATAQPAPQPQQPPAEVDGQDGVLELDGAGDEAMPQALRDAVDAMEDAADEARNPFLTGHVGKIPVYRITIPDLTHGDKAALSRAIGTQIGKAAKHRLKRWIAKDQQMVDMRKWIASDEKHQQIYDRILQDSKRAYPHYFLELEAMAAGAEGVVTVDDLNLSNLRGEILQYSDPMDTTKKSCTDVFLVNRETEANPLPFAGYAHNDDWDNDWQDVSYFVEAYANDSEEEPPPSSRAARHSSQHSFQFTSYCYPGFLVGMDFLLTRFGTTLTVNSLFPAKFGESGVGTAFISRALVEAQSFAAAVRIIADPRASTGGSWNLGSMTSETALVNIETITGGKHHVLDVLKVGEGEGVGDDNDHSSSSTVGAARNKNNSSTVYFHANEYRHLKFAETQRQRDEVQNDESKRSGGNFFSDPSTEHRLAKFQEYVGTTTTDGKKNGIQREQDLLSFLSDRSDPVYPVWRQHSSDKDPCYTEVSGVFDLRTKKLKLYADLSKRNDAEKPDRVYDWQAMVGSPDFGSTVLPMAMEVYA